MVCVFHNVSRVHRGSCSEVYGVHNFGVSFLCPFAELVKTEFVGFGCLPCEVKSCGTVFLGSYGVFPLKAGYEVAARITCYGNVEILYEVDNVTSESALVSCGMTGFVYACVNRASEMFDE